MSWKFKQKTRRKYKAKNNSKFKINSYRKRRLIKRNQKASRGFRSRPNHSTALINQAYHAGQSAAEHIPTDHPDSFLLLNEHWNSWNMAAQQRLSSWQLHWKMAEHYVKGFAAKSGRQNTDWVLMPTTQKVAVIVTVMNEEQTVFSVLEQLRRLPLHEVIFIVNGTTDRSFDLIRKHSGAMIVDHPQPLGHDVGRALGARISRADILVFLDGDFPIFAEHLIPFIQAIEKGQDIALNNISPYLSTFSQHDSVTVMKEFLNRSLGRKDLCANSLTAIPHAISSGALAKLGVQSLSVPPMAQAKAILLGLKLSSPFSVDVISKNKKRKQMNTGSQSPVSDMIIGDHLEAIAWSMQQQNERLGHQDLIRDRSLVKGATI